ncbi:MAG: type II toxin-antitoxin system MqsA family antitoxin [Gammaproteobacteria bacterium]|nr:type II toxin-antitoxin system MqsA family antitoxin [Xanthomonadales bacterium]
MNKKEIDKMVEAAEVDAGHELPGLKESLAELNTGNFVAHTPTNILLKNVRNKLSMNQLEFAELIKTPIGTLRDWEQGRIEASGVVLSLAKLLNNHPELAAEL